MEQSKVRIIKHERREFRRLVVELPCNIYYNNKEYVGTLQDVSEKGACLVVTGEPSFYNIQIGERISFQFCDTIIDVPTVEVFGGVARVERVAHPSIVKTVIGISVHNRSFYEYVGAKKTSDYLRHLEKLRKAEQKQREA